MAELCSDGLPLFDNDGGSGVASVRCSRTGRITDFVAVVLLSVAWEDGWNPLATAVVSMTPMQAASTAFV